MSDSMADALAPMLARVLGGEVLNLRRLSGGASRTTWAFDLQAGDEHARRLIVQVERQGAVRSGQHMSDESDLLRAAMRAGVPVAPVVASGNDETFGAGWMVVERLEGETIPRKLLRDPEFADARSAMVAQCGHALAAVHRIAPASVPALVGGDQLTQFTEILHALGSPRPALELAARRLNATRPEAGDDKAVVHGDFRNGNLLVGPDGLRAVLDWELAHLGDPLEDLGWFCVRAWRFGSAQRAGGFGSDDELVTAYEQAAGRQVDREALRWWEAVGTFKWAVMCMLQAASQHSGGRSSVELATIGRRVCENEWDLLGLLGIAPPDEPPLGGHEGAPASTDAARGTELFGPPTAAELVDAVRDFLVTDVAEATAGRVHFHARVAANALGIVGRQLTLWSEIVERESSRLHRLGIAGETAMVEAIRSGSLDGRWDEVARAVCGSVRDQLMVSNPRYLEPDA